MSAGHAIEIFKEKGLPRDVVRRFDLARHGRARTPSATPAWRPRARSRPSTVASVLDRRSISAWCTTARSATTTGCARCCAATASSSRPTTTPRWRPRYLTWRMRQGASLHEALEAGLKRPRRLLHLLRRHQGRLRRAARPDRLQARGAGRDRRLGGDGDRVPRHRPPAGRREARIWEPAPAQVYSWGRALR